MKEKPAASGFLNDENDKVDDENDNEAEKEGKTTCTVNTKDRAMSIPSSVQGTEVQVWKDQDEARDGCEQAHGEQMPC